MPHSASLNISETDYILKALPLHSRHDGTVEAGKVANPLESVSAWDRIEIVMLNGQAKEREELASVR